ncbi:type III-B CRISPR-associated protein Cas10/Cmr2 [Laceyella tengchongensis]|jgi:CRISPR-associated protein Cmr2
MFFHWTISPVQDFVAQSRRPRDLLVSSFLLSYLSGVAMKAVLEQNGRIIFPSVYDQQTKEISNRLLMKILNKPTAESPWIGTLPNRFKAEVKENFKPEACVDAVDEAWKKIADNVWDYLQRQIERAPSEEKKEWMRDEVEQIWKRQTSCFWEQQWGMSNSDDILLRRKHWRVHLPSIEEGAKCTMMSDWQELSGYWDDTDEQKRFWRALDENVPKNELSDKERLCSIALIKRFFPYVAESAIGWAFPQNAMQIPSISSLAVLPWLKKMDQKLKEEEKKGNKVAFLAEKYLQSLSKLNTVQVDYDDYFPNDLPSLSPAVKPLSNIDGTYLLEHALEREIDAKIEKRSLKRSNKNEIINNYKDLCDAVGSQPSPYFALIMMDGDRLGTLIRKEKNNYRISQALDQFTGKFVHEISFFSAIPIYCGGDDVLLMLPMAQALPCAIQLHQWYEQAFNQYIGEKEATSSIAIAFAHTQSPLQNVLDYIRYLLDEVAKEKTGRNSLAIGIWKRSGAELEWSAPWDQAEHGRSAIDELLRLQQTTVEVMGRQIPLTKILTNQFLNRFSQFDRLPLYKNDSILRKNLMEDMLVEELFRTHKVKKEERGLFERVYHELSQAILALCFESRRDEKGKLQFANGRYSPIGAQLLKFMREQGGI